MGGRGWGGRGGGQGRGAGEGGQGGRAGWLGGVGVKGGRAGWEIRVEGREGEGRRAALLAPPASWHQTLPNPPCTSILAPNPT